MFRAAAVRAAADTGVELPADLLHDAVAIGCPAMFLEFRWARAFGQMPFKNFPRTVANELGANPADEFCWLSWHGGNEPQFLVNNFSSLISKGEIPQGPILVGGLEENAAFDRAVRGGNKEALEKMGWADGDRPPAAAPTLVNQLHASDDELFKECRRQSGKNLGSAIISYAIYENAYAHSLGRARRSSSRRSGAS